jgi:hypothetical protein
VLGLEYNVRFQNTLLLPRVRRISVWGSPEQVRKEEARKTSGRTETRMFFIDVFMLSSIPSIG